MAGSTTAFDGRGDATGPAPMVESKSPTLPLASTPIGAGCAFRFRGRWGRLFFMAYLSLLKTPYSLENLVVGGQVPQSGCGGRLSLGTICIRPMEKAAVFAAALARPTLPR